jgi:glycosyltransferase involved in cell wall biosynthesis
VRILIWHGYLLGGTGSNEYTRSLARAWRRRGHDVVVVCQEPHPGRFDLGGARVARPHLDTRLPVFVLDSYEDLQPCLLAAMPAAERDRFVEQNAAAVRAAGPLDFLLVNHVLLGAPVGAASGGPFVVMAHGSELEFALRGNPELCDWARATLSAASTVVVGSRHTAGVLCDVVGVGDYTSHVRVVPPGVDVDELRPQARSRALPALVEQCRRDPPNPGRRDERRPDAGNAERLADFLSGDAPTVVYVGKLSAEKGVSLLLEALAQLDRPEVRAVIVGFGPQREELERQARGRVLFTGPLEHRHLAHLWPLADVSVTPSVFPEGFGMVAAEAASCGSPPLVAHHSGLAEVAAALEAEYPPHARHLASFTGGDALDLCAKLDELLSLPRSRWAEISQAARRTAVENWSWDTIAGQLLNL